MLLFSIHYKTTLIYLVRNVVYTMMLNEKKILSNLGQPYPCLIVGEAIYQLGKQIQWHVPFLQDITLRLGGIHRDKNFLSVIGKRMKLTGLKEILKASEIYGPTQIEGNTKIGVLNLQSKSWKNTYEEVIFETCNFTKNELPLRCFPTILIGHFTW